MATTTNYSWSTPDDTALVKDGAAAIRTLGSSIDTTTKNLNPSTTLGDIEYRSSTANTNTRLAIGSSDNVLKVSGGVPAWGVDPTADLITTAGDLVYGTAADTMTRLGIGTAGQVLKVNSGATAPEWGAAGATPSFSLLATQAVTTGSSYSITSLSGYNTLFVICAGLSSTAGSTTYTMTFNNDSASNYIVGAAGIDSGSAGQYGGTDTKISWATQGNNAANLVSASFQISAANSTGTKVGMQGGGGNGTASLVRFGGFSYSGSSVISSVQITTSGTFDAGTIYVYGSVA
jgi:hypothetical protein